MLIRYVDGLQHIGVKRDNINREEKDKVVREIG